MEENLLKYITGIIIFHSQFTSLFFKLDSIERPSGQKKIISSKSNFGYIWLHNMYTSFSCIPEKWSKQQS